MGPAETLSAATCHRGVRPRQLRGHLRDRQCLLHALKARRQGGLVEVQPELAAPAVEHAWGRAKAGPRVDKGRAAQAPSERHQDRRGAERRRLPAIAVETGQHLRRMRVEGVRVMVRALLEHHHSRAPLSQLRRHNRAARASADHAHVGVQATRARCASHGRPSRRRSSRPRPTTAAASQPSERPTVASS